MGVIASQNTGTWLFAQQPARPNNNEIIKTPNYCPFVRRMVDPRRKGPIMHEAFAYHEVIFKQNFNM